MFRQVKSDVKNKQRVNKPRTANLSATNLQGSNSKLKQLDKKKEPSITQASFMKPNKLDKKNEQRSSSPTQDLYEELTEDDESTCENDTNITPPKYNNFKPLNNIGNEIEKSTKDSSAGVTVFNTVHLLDELTFAKVLAYNEQKHKFDGMGQHFDYIGNIDRKVKKQIKTTLITGGMDENRAMNWENIDFDDVLQGLLLGLSTKDANSYQDELREIKFNLTDPVDSTKLYEWINQITTLDYKYESYLEEIKNDVDENKALVKIQTDSFSGPNASMGLKRLKQLLAGKKVENIEDLTTQVAIILRDEKKYCLAARAWGYELSNEKFKSYKRSSENYSQDNDDDYSFDTKRQRITFDKSIDKPHEKPTFHGSEKPKVKCSACGNKKHTRDACPYLAEDPEVNTSTIVPWADSKAGEACRNKYGWTQLPPPNIRSSIAATHAESKKK